MRRVDSVVQQIGASVPKLSRQEAMRIAYVQMQYGKIGDRMRSAESASDREIMRGELGAALEEARAVVEVLEELVGQA